MIKKGEWETGDKSFSYANLPDSDASGAGKSGGAEMKIRKYLIDNDYNLSLSSYVQKEDTREVIDITVLNAKIEGIVARESELHNEIDKIIAEIEG